MDTSGSIGSHGYQDELEFAAKVTEYFDVGADGTRIASVTYGSYSSTDFDFNDYLTSSKAASKLRGLSYRGGSTATYAGLDSAAALFASSSSGVRPVKDGISRVVILMTDGRSNSQKNTIAAGQRLKDKNVNVFGIGLGTKLGPLDLIFMMDLTGNSCATLTSSL